MKSFVHYIGILDHSDSSHWVSFGPGVNVVTGRSSTGKSALLEIFDYCFGSSEFTVPEGVITEHAKLYFVSLEIEGANVFLARKPKSGHAYIKQLASDTAVPKASELTESSFEDGYFLPLSDFRRELGRFFRISVTDVDESLVAKKIRGDRKKPAPSVRSFTSFMLQHQNLIANKHAIFYRFDEYEKREQAIEHFKIFAGFVTQEYFTRTQRLESLEAERKQVEVQIPREAELRTKAEAEMGYALSEYAAASGASLFEESASDAVKNPKKTLKIVREARIAVVPLSDVHAKQKQELEEKLSKVTSESRRLQQQIRSIDSSISFAKRYVDQASVVNVPREASLTVSSCPFCFRLDPGIEKEANKLSDAIEWLNDELRKSPYLMESFESEKKKVEDSLKSQQAESLALQDRIQALDSQIVDLAKHRSQYELSLRAKLRIEGILEALLAKKDSALDDKLKRLKEEIAVLKAYLKEHFDVETKLKEAEKIINSHMATIGEKFEFEYKPIKLHFSLATFDLWHQAPTKKIFLRSMGSGANWLYCHLTLFLALHRYFCELGEKCAIPSILFLDQPSQVYFPSALDRASEFQPEELAELAGPEKVEKLDHDIGAVTNLYSQLVRFCSDTLKETGIEPQIIVTDHADHLHLDGEITFESLVGGRRWRHRGFIDFPAPGEPEESHPSETK